jgi:hypothetical protein
MGFRYKFENNRKILMERSSIIAKKIKFLRTYLQYLKNYPNVKFIYLDETWIYRYGSQEKTWVNDDLPSTNYNIPKTEGKRFTILYSGSAYGAHPTVRVRSPVRYQK